MITLGLAAAVSGTDPQLLKRKFGSGMTTLITSNEEMYDIMIIKIIKSLKELAEEFHKPIIRKFEEWKVGSSFIDKF